MNYFEKLHEYLDGTLDKAGEEELFAALLSDAALREDFRQLLSINNALDSNRALFDVPESAGKNIFGALGIENNPGAGSAPVKSSSKKQNFLSALAGAAAMLIILLLLDWPLGGNDSYSAADKSENQNPESAVTQNENSEQSSNDNFGNEFISSDIAEGNDRDDNDRFAGQAFSNDAENANGSSLDERQGGRRQFVSAEKRDNSTDAGTLYDSEISYSDRYSLNKNDKDISDRFVQPSPIFPRYSDPVEREIRVIPVTGISEGGMTGYFNSEKKFLLELKGSQYWMIPEATIAPAEIAGFHNFSGGIYYKLNPNLHIGAELRQESYYQVFNGLDEAGDYYEYRQQPNFTTYSGVLRYKAGTGKIEPVLQAALGGNKVGMVGRALAGLEYSPYKNISFVAGLEYSHMLYKYQNEIFNSSKFGLNYGIIFGF
ncbi:MAG: anti-sigma factor family protein [Candidatus Kapaibacterium sp.]